MKTIKHTWDIQRSKKQQRCGICFVVLKKSQLKHKIKGAIACIDRYPYMCHKHYENKNTTRDE